MTERLTHDKIRTRMKERSSVPRQLRARLNLGTRDVGQHRNSFESCLRYDLVNLLSKSLAGPVLLNASEKVERWRH